MIKWLKRLTQQNITTYSFDVPSDKYAPVSGDIWLKPLSNKELEMYFFEQGEWHLVHRFGSFK